MSDIDETGAFFDETSVRYNRTLERGQFRDRQEWFLSIASKVLASSTVDHPLCIDLGCGPGAMTLDFAELGFETIGVDSSEGMLALAEQAAAESSSRRKNCTFVHSDLTTFLSEFERQADLVVASSVLEYLADPAEVLRLVAKRLRNAGVFAASVPNLLSIYRKVEPLVILRKPKDMRYTRHWKNGIRPGDFIAAASSHGLDLVETSYFGQPHVAGRPIISRLSRFQLLGTMTLFVFRKTA